MLSLRTEAFSDKTITINVPSVYIEHSILIFTAEINYDKGVSVTWHYSLQLHTQDIVQNHLKRHAKAMYISCKQPIRRIRSASCH